MLKNFEKPLEPSHYEQFQIQLGDDSSTSGTYPSNGSSQFKAPFTPPLWQPAGQIEQGRYSSRPGVPLSNRAAQFRVPPAPFSDVPTTPLPRVLATPSVDAPTTPLPRVLATPSVDAPTTPPVGLSLAAVGPRIRESEGRYAQGRALRSAPVDARASEGGPHMRELSPLVLQAQRVLERTPVAVVAVVVGLVTLLVHGYRLSVAPDVFSDEGIYLLVGNSLASGAGLTINHSVFLWHPPAYMLVEAVYIKLAGLTNADPLVALLSVRYLNIFFSASTAVLLMLFGRKLHSYKAGLIMAALFLMDPYVQRINRRDMLETLAMLCVLLGLYIFFTRRPHLTTRQRLGSGVIFGLAMLTKEAMFLELFTLIAYVTWFRRSQLRDVAWVAAIACAVYLVYPAWEVAMGQGNSYLSYKLFGINRILSSIIGHPLPSPPPVATLTPAAPQAFS